MLLKYIEICETIGGLLAIFGFYYTIYECYKIGYSINSKKSLLETVKANKSGLLAITFLTIYFLMWVVSMFMLGKSIHSTPTPPIKSPSEWTQPRDKDLQKTSEIMATIHYQYSGRSSLTYNVDEDKWVPFSPTDLDIKNRDEYVILNEKIHSQTNHVVMFFLFVISIWFTVGLIGWNACDKNNS